ncbi:MAG: cytochrome P450 [Myxococcota bacterium]
MVQYDPFSAEVMNDPHPVYARLREEAPVYHLEKFDAWALSRFEDVWNCSMDRRFSAARGTTSAHLLTKVQPVTPMLNVMDPPQHTQLRGRMREFFVPSKVRALEPTIRELAAGCLDAARERGRMDVVHDFAAQVATKIACTVNGIPLEDGDLLNDLVQRFFKREPGVEGMTPDGLAAMEEMFGYFVGILRKRRADPQDDLVSMLTQVEIDGEKIDDMAGASHLSMLIIGGSETFPKVFANLVRRLGEHPDQRAEIAADPSLAPDAFQEGVRYDMPTQFLCRSLLEPVELHGRTMQAGDPVLFLYTSANRDPREFESPDTFDIHRKAPRILSFGHGTHLCLGIHVAKAEGRVCLEEMLKRMPEYALDLENAERLVTDFVQGYSSFPVTFNPW